MHARIMDKAFTLRILTPEGTAFEGPVEAAFLPGSAGRFEVLPGHAPIVSTLERGEIRWRAAGAESSIAIRSGALMLKDKTLTVCAEAES